MCKTGTKHVQDWNQAKVLFIVHISMNYVKKIHFRMVSQNNTSLYQCYQYILEININVQCQNHMTVWTTVPTIGKYFMLKPQKMEDWETARKRDFLVKNWPIPSTEYTYIVLYIGQDGEVITGEVDHNTQSRQGETGGRVGSAMTRQHDGTFSNKTWDSKEQPLPEH